MVKKVIAFVDGENLVFRYQDMLDRGRVPLSQVVHTRNAFVWSPQITDWTAMDLVRVSYYTSVVGTDQKVADLEDQISKTPFSCYSQGLRGNARIIPRVHKKAANSRKTKVVDVDITMDVMRAAADPSIEAIYLLTGDGDYLPLVREITRRTSKQVFLGAFSLGLSPPLRSAVEQFIDLDPKFFQRPAHPEPAPSPPTPVPSRKPRKRKAKM